MADFQPKKKYSFAEQVVLSKEYENKMLTYWNKLEEVIQVGDVRDKQKYRDMDIDFVHMRLHAGVLKARTLELKVDFRIGETGNLFIEKDGWLSKTRAETLAYLDTINKRCYYISTKKLRDYIDVHQNELMQVEVETSDFGGYKVIGLLLPYTRMVQNLCPYVEDLTSIL